MNSDAAVCLLCGRPSQIDALYFPIEKIRYHLCRDCHDGPDQSLRIEERLANPQHVATDHCELEQRVTAGRAVVTRQLGEIQELHGRIAKLMLMGETGRCRDCGAAVTWMRNHATGRALPYDSNGKSHFSTCPKKAELVMEVHLREAT